MLTKRLTRSFFQVPRVLATSYPFATTHSSHHCNSSKELHNIFNPALMANMPLMQKRMQNTNLGLQYYNFLLDCFTETKLLQSDLTFLQFILQKLADPDTYKG